jgi:hypothetical protein
MNQKADKSTFNWTQESIPETFVLKKHFLDTKNNTKQRTWRDSGGTFVQTKYFVVVAHYPPKEEPNHLSKMSRWPLLSNNRQ